MLGGIPRYVEMLVYAIGDPTNRNEFSWDTFRESLKSDSSKIAVCKTAHALVRRVSKYIETRYGQALLVLLPEIPHKIVVGYSVFEFPVGRATKIGTSKTVADLEKSGAIFLRTKQIDGDDVLILTFPLVLLLLSLACTTTRD